MVYDYRTALRLVDYPQRETMFNPQLDKSVTVRWGCPVADFHRLMRLLSKLPPSVRRRKSRYLSLYTDSDGDKVLFLVETISTDS